jgi:hypothetical protein
MRISRNRMSYSRRIAIGTGFLLVVLLAGLSGTGAAAGSGESARDFPLATQIPSKHYAKLQGGQARLGKWAMFVYRTEGQGSICIVGLRAKEDPSGGVSVSAGSPSCRAGDDHQTRLVTALGLTRPRRRILAFGFDARVKRVELETSTGHTKMLNTVPLTEAQAASVGTPRFVSVVASDRPGRCFTRLRTFGANGQVIGGTPLASDC